MMRRVFLPVLALFLVPLFGRADGFIVITDGPRVPGHFTFAPLEVSFHHVTVDIHDQVATTAVEEEFYNPNPRQLEGTYLFPLPAGSHIDKFAMDINGRVVDAELLSAEKARSLYEEIVRKAKDPALLEYVGRDAFKVRIFPIEPNGRKRIKISYTQLLKSDSGLTEYSYPLNTEKFSSKPLREVSIKVNLSCAQPLRSVYSPSHAVEIRRDGEKTAVVGFEQRDVRPDTDFKMIYTQDAKDVGINLLTYRDGSGDGYFMLMASPGNTSKGEAIGAKDVTFILDTSGSMAGPKMEQAKKALNFCLANLNEKDNFEVVRFSTEVEPLFDKLMPATKENVDHATSFLKDMKPIGATAIDEALTKALSYSHNSTRPYVVIFLTDGQPTIGETSEDAIVDHVRRLRNEHHDKTPIFSFGIGTDVNTHLLDRIADDAHGFSTYVLPEEDIEVKLSNFYTKIKDPTLSDVKLSFTGEGFRTTELYPNTMPDLFRGEVLIAFGRYSGHGNGSVKITGTINGKAREFATDVTFAQRDTANAFIPKLWAVRRVGWLLDEMRLHGESKELQDEVVRLARQYGIVTPYTAYLIMEDERVRGVPEMSQNFRELSTDPNTRGVAERFYKSTQEEFRSEAARSGGQAVANATNFGALKDANQLPSVAATSPALAKPGQQSGFGYRQNQNYAQQARVLNGRAFYQNGNVWTDSTLQKQQNAKQVQVKFDSDEYFALLTGHPEAAQWLSLGNNVDLQLDGIVYSVRE